MAEMGKFGAFLHRLNPCKRREDKVRSAAEKRIEKSDQYMKLLLECEQKGKAIIEAAQARRREIKNLAKKAAEKEASEVRKEREKKFKTFCEAIEKKSKETEREIAEENLKTLIKINEQAKQNKEKILKMLMGEFMKIEPKVHQNVKYTRGAYPGAYRSLKSLESTQSCITTKSTQSLRSRA